MSVLHSTIHYGNAVHTVEYHDADSFDHLPAELCHQMYGLCFVGNKMVIGFGGNKQAWGLIGGTVETGESFRQTLEREIKEESNMRVMEAVPVGYQLLTSPLGAQIYQLRFWCSVIPYGPFVEDPDGGVSEIKLIDPVQSKDYFDWGSIGDRLIERATALNQQYLAKL